MDKLKELLKKTKLERENSIKLANIAKDKGDHEGFLIHNAQASAYDRIIIAIEDRLW